MKNLIKLFALFSILTVLAFATSCAFFESDDSSSEISEGATAQASSQPESVDEQFIGTVVDDSGLPLLRLDTIEGSVTVDTSGATIFGDLKIGTDVEVLFSGGEVVLVSVANENLPAVVTNGIIIAAEGDTLTMTNGDSTLSFDLLSADILSPVTPSVGDTVEITTAEDGRVIKLKMIAFGGGKISGTGSELTEQVLIVETADDKLFPFSIEDMVLSEDIAQGSLVSVTYTGSLAGTHNVLGVEISSELPAAGTLEGIVTDIVSSIIMVRDDFGTLFAFSREADNTFSNGRLLIGDTVRVEYAPTDGYLFANSVTQISYGAKNLFELDGILTRFDPGVLSIRTENGNTFTLSHNEATGIFTAEEPQVGMSINLYYELNDNDFLRCVALFDPDTLPPVVSATGVITNIDETENTVTMIVEGEEMNFSRDGATLNSSLPLRRDDNITVDYIEFPSGMPLATNITFNSAPTTFVPTALAFKTSGVTIGTLISAGDLLCVKDDDGRVYAFDASSAVMPEGGVNLGDRLNIQYLGDPIQSAVAVLVTVAQ